MTKVSSRSGKTTVESSLRTERVAMMSRPGWPTPHHARNLQQLFRRPPLGWGGVPFWWWNGDRLDPRRLRWQLDLLRPARLAGMQINYCHSCRGGRTFGLTDAGEPTLFSQSWWRIFRQVARDCRNRGLQIGISDYTLSWTGQGWWTDTILPAEARTAPVLGLTEQAVVGGNRITIPLPIDTVTVAALPTGSRSVQDLVDLNASCSDSHLRWSAPDGTWRILIVHIERDVQSINALHPAAGRSLLAGLHRPGVRAAGRAANFFFQDEFHMSSRIAWDESLLECLDGERRLLPALLTDLGPEGASVRLRWMEATAALARRHFFIPVGRFHRQHGLLYGCDQWGRGLAPAEYGDYFGALRHFTAPGHDVPCGQVDVFKAKCSSSVAHLARQPRVWMEAYHSSGWGVSPERIVADTLGNLAVGCTLVSLHGLYYSTHGGHWEWAPPDFHWRQPFWAHFQRFLHVVERLCFVLSQGVHRCDVAVVYPTASAQVGVANDVAIATCRAVVEGLWAQGIDCDLLDRQALDEAKVADGSLNVAGESYRTLILPGLVASHAVAVQRALELLRSGGSVFAVKPLPGCTEVGGEDPLLKELALEVPLVADATAAVTRVAALPRLFRGPPGSVACQRRIGDRDVALVVGAPGGSTVWLRTHGRCELWDAWRGTRQSWPHAVEEGDGLRVDLPSEDAPGGGWLVVVDRTRPPARSRSVLLQTKFQRMPLDGPWEFHLKPTLDNRWGDFRLPATSGHLGPELRRLRVAPAGAPWRDPQIDDSTWSEVDTGFGPRFLSFGPVPDADRMAVEARLAAAHSAKDLADLPSREVVLSWRWGIPGDPGEQGWHGLKGVVHDDIFGIGIPGKLISRGHYKGIPYLPERPDEGPRWMWTTVITSRPVRASLVVGGLMPEAVWVGGLPTVPGSVVDLPPGRTPVLTRYTGTGRAYLVLLDTAVAEPSRQELSSRWHKHPGLLPLDPRWEDAAPCNLRALSPPGLRAITGVVRGRLEVWIQGQPAPVRLGRQQFDGARAFTVRVRRPSPDPVVIALAVEGDPGWACASALVESPVLICGKGRLAAGDWSQVGGLADYSGMATYGRTVTLRRRDSLHGAILDLGAVRATAKVRINGHEAGVLCATPWRLAIGRWLVVGRNRIEIEVASTLANHYRTIPTRYAGDPKAGLLGPVSILIPT